MKSKSRWESLGNHISPETGVLGVALEVARSKYATDVVTGYGVVPVVVVHVGYPQESSLIAVRIRAVVIETEGVFR